MKINYLLVVFIVIVFSACKEPSVPRPRGFFRIELPEKVMRRDTLPCGPSFELARHLFIENFRERISDTCWFNLYSPRYKARVHCTMFPVDDNLNELIETAYQFAFKHEVKAKAIGRKSFQNSSRNADGLVYNLEGNVASPIQFYVTDSTRHFLRGSLYFMSKPNEDSLAPVKAYFEDDIEKLMNSIEWPK